MKFIETVKKMLPGCAIALVIAVAAKLLEQLEESAGLHLIGAPVIATFIGIGCCYAGFLGGVAFMMEGVHAKELTLKCAAAQTIGGIVAGVIANYAYVLIF